MRRKCFRIDVANRMHVHLLVTLVRLNHQQVAMQGYVGGWWPLESIRYSPQVPSVSSLCLFILFLVPLARLERLSVDHPFSLLLANENIDSLQCRPLDTCTPCSDIAQMFDFMFADISH